MMKMKLYNITAVLLVLSGLPLHAQVLSNEVINSGGKHMHMQSSGAGISITGNVGEPFTETLGPVGQMMISQGFLQPEIMNGITVIKNDPTCTGRGDGYISISFSSLNDRHEEQYIWSPATSCPGGNCGNKLENLSPGTYSLTVVSIFTTNTGAVGRDTLIVPPVTIAPSTEPCLLKVYSGVTPNNDGINDIWIIENISEFPSNRVSIYNRWGNLMFETQGYDNESNFWPASGDLDRLVSGTYFYIIELGDGSKPLKGWVELLKN